jgi:PAS domain S-box-containing protein
LSSGFEVGGIISPHAGQTASAVPGRASPGDTTKAGSPPPEIGSIYLSEKELRDFFENAAVALHWVGEEGTILWANPAELKLLGYSAEEYIGHNIAEFHADRTVIQDILQRLHRNETLDRQAARMRRKDGSIRFVEISSSVYREEGRFVHTRCVTIDVTEQRKSLELQERLAAIVECSDDAIISKDLNGVIRSWNSGAQRLFGYTAEEIIGQHASVLGTPDRPDEISEILARVARGERVDHYETRRKTKDGRVLSVSLTVSPIRDASGTIIAASKVARDISGQKRLSELQERLAAIVEFSDDAIISKDLNGIVESWNESAERVFGYTAAEMIGRSITTIIPDDRLGEEPEILRRLQRGERVDHFETLRKHKDGTLLNISLTISPVRDGQGRIVGASKVARNITERKRQEQALLEANAALTRSNDDLQQFVYSASHDLQEPLRMVAAYSELLKMEFGGQLGAAGDEYIGYTLHGAMRMEQLLKDLRAYTLVSTCGQTPAEELDSNRALDKALADLETAIAASKASVTRTPLPAVHLHEFQLEQLFQNLIGNSIRYRSGDPPRIHVAARRQGADWLFSVQDNGIGIKAQYHQQVFGMFQRLHSIVEYPGTGMGLAICQRIIERAGGRIWVASEPGRGSTFFFTIPIAAGEGNGN